MKISPMLNFVFWVVITFISLQGNLAGIVLLTVPFVFFYLLACGYLWLKKNLVVKPIIRTLVMIFGSYTIVGITHLIRVHEQRSQADQLLQKIQGYKSQNGVYPANIAAMGVTKLKMKENRMNYSFRENQPSLYYFAKSGMLAHYHFDFERQIWVYEVL